ncbi:hypothetical protein [Pseudooctadecabacter sp.]|uniref:hypothetical protein n=1 Tax=Pseudooctadecabacter sp. TaxID=1966338 RepID=UPI0025E9B74B|nr:hypothetical protein [Pseudooctadecabacter sp.]
MFQSKTARLLVTLLLWPVAVLSQTSETAPPNSTDPVAAPVVIVEPRVIDILDPEIDAAVRWLRDQTDRMEAGADRADIDLSGLDDLLVEGWTDDRIDFALFRHLRRAQFNEDPPDLARFADRNWDDANQLEFALNNFAFEYGGLFPDMEDTPDGITAGDVANAYFDWSFVQSTVALDTAPDPWHYFLYRARAAAHRSTEIASVADDIASSRNGTINIRQRWSTEVFQYAVQADLGRRTYADLNDRWKATLLSAGLDIIETEHHLLVRFLDSEDPGFEVFENSYLTLALNEYGRLSLNPTADEPRLDWMPWNPDGIDLAAAVDADLLAETQRVFQRYYRPFSIDTRDLDLLLAVRPDAVEVDFSGVELSASFYRRPLDVIDVSNSLLDDVSLNYFDGSFIRLDDNAYVTELSAYRARPSAFMEVSGVTSADFDMRHIDTRFLGLQTLRAVGDGVRFDLQHGSAREVDLFQITGPVTLRMFKTNHDFVWVTEADISGNLELWSSDIGVMTIRRSTLTDGVTGEFGHFNAFRIWDSTVGEVDFSSAQVDTYFYLNNVTVTARADFIGLTATEAYVQCVSAPTLILDGSTISEYLVLRSLNVGTLDVRDAQVANANISNKALTDDQVAEWANVPANPAPLSQRPDAEAPISDASETTDETPVSDCDSATRIGRLNLYDSVFGVVNIGVRLQDILIMNHMRAVTVRFESERLAMTPGAQILMRSATIDRLVLAPRLFPREDQDPFLIDVTNSDVGRIDLYNPDRDAVSALDQGGAAMASAPKVDAGDLRTLFARDLPRALSLLPDAEGRIDAPYQPQVYTLLRASSSTAGFPDVARRLAISQNEHFASQLPKEDVAQRVLYWMGGVINQYGYNNLRGIVLLAFIVVLPWLWFNRHLAGWVSGSLRAGRKLDRPAPPVANSFFRSIDRTIPTLQLDEAFSKTHSLTKWDVRIIYLQRIFGFIVILFILGGVFEVFQ